MALMICLTLLLNTKTAAIEPYVEKTKKDCMECHIDKYYPAGDFFKAETETKWHYQWWIFSIGFFIFSCGVMAKLYMWNIGRGKIFSEKIEWKRFLDFLFFEVIFQRKIFKASYLRWFIFFSESMGFLMLFLFFLVLVLTRFIFKIDFFISGAGGLALDFMLDFIGLLILCGTVVSFVRRCLKKNNLITEREDIVAVLFLFFIVLTGFFLEAFRLAVLPFSFESYFSFVGFGMASIIRNIDLPWTVIRYYTWIIHAIIVLIFLAYIPFSKFIHFMTCPVSTLAMSSDPQG
jgi:nitrate reductase gamma subunit